MYMENIIKEINWFNRNFEYDISKWNVKWVFFGGGGWMVLLIFVLFFWIFVKWSGSKGK